MKTHYKMATSQSVTGSFAARLLGVGIVALPLVALLFSGSVQAIGTTPNSGDLITNTAQATYSVGGGSPVTVTSNTVTTTVLPVGQFTLDTSQNFNVAPGQVKEILHTVTNKGNASDTFNISLPLALPGTLTSIKIIEDSNNNGVLDPGETTILCTVPGCSNISTGVLAPGAKYNFFVQMTVSPIAAPGSTATAQINAASITPANYPTPAEANKSNTDVLTLTNAAIFDVQKSIISTSSGTWNSTAGLDITYKLHYVNSGATAGPLYIEDTIGAGATAGFTYLVGTPVWLADSTAGITNVTLTDATGVETDAAAANKINYIWDGTNKVKVYIVSVAAGGTGDITFRVKVKDQNVAVGTSQTNNSASFAVPALSNACTASSATVCSTTPTSLTATTPSAFTVLAVGNFDLLKEQALGVWTTDHCAAPTPTVAYSNGNLEQKPGQCIWYKITATNNTGAAVQNISITDSIPTLTTFASMTNASTSSKTCSANGAVAADAPGTTPDIGTTGSITCEKWSSIPTGGSQSMTFAVRVNITP